MSYQLKVIMLPLTHGTPAHGTLNQLIHLQNGFLKLLLKSNEFCYFYAFLFSNFLENKQK